MKTYELYKQPSIDATQDFRDIDALTKSIENALQPRGYVEGFIFALVLSNEPDDPEDCIFLFIGDDEMPEAFGDDLYVGGANPRALAEQLSADFG